MSESVCAACVCEWGGVAGCRRAHPCKHARDALCSIAPASLPRTNLARPSAKSEEFELEGETDVYAEEGALSKLHGHSHSSVPIFRLLANNWLGLILHIAFMVRAAGSLPGCQRSVFCGLWRAVAHPTPPASRPSQAWVAGAFYTTVTWLPTSLKEAGTPTIVAQVTFSAVAVLDAVLTGLHAEGGGRSAHPPPPNTHTQTTPHPRASSSSPCCSTLWA